ncbi:hypothetical protein DI09_20p170 [Mitosporidium daphniae]|uniref:Transcriptional adapter 2 n=1 Tax=Mitosporidium daphniae TaxID=1485682 RepID=A0A098VSY6_9MICR|nr:uncharacterized protein DI09_20p170 [Mitosporidium daphniae]KGG52100.1 hypothetical protein DI09_20p170 [Mitosporidium daphniae]|eukprot:XP_013238527.1 uncharacterized protein DI09_20p170 [Mitosporidium daphniae]
MTVTYPNRIYASSIDANEVGAKCMCDVCHLDISNTIYINCAECSNVDLCISCFSSGSTPAPSFTEKLPQNQNASPPPQHKATHAYYEPLDFPIFDPKWRADEEIYLLEALEKVGIGNWIDISFYLGSKTPEECESHYRDVYLSNKNTLVPHQSQMVPGRFKLPLCKAPIQEPPANSISSSPSDHELVGYMPKREEFETEFENDAEHLVKDICFLDTDNEFERGERFLWFFISELKFAILFTYCDALEKREERKRTIFEHNLVEYKKLTTIDKDRAKEEKDIHQTLIPFARFMSKEDFALLTADFIDEFYLKKYIHHLQTLRKKGFRTIEHALNYNSKATAINDQIKSAANISIKITPKVALWMHYYPLRS